MHAIEQGKKDSSMQVKLADTSLLTRILRRKIRAREIAYEVDLGTIIKDILL